MKKIFTDTGRDSIVVNNLRMLDEEESLNYLNIKKPFLDKKEYVQKINRKYSDRIKNYLKESYTVTIIGLGDVGGNLLLGLKLLGHPTIESINIYNPGKERGMRYEMEMNQIYSENFDVDIPIEIISEDEIFNSDVVIFTASRSVPDIGDEAVDVRKVQFKGNSEILTAYVKSAKEKEYKGLFLIVSDPVDLLCKVALERSDGALLPSQIAGFGQGVMFARALYFSKKMQVNDFKEKGRIYGPHGSELIVANSVEDYDDELSKELTQVTVEANLTIRKLGFKPYIAPAISSGALSILSYLRGEATYSSQYINGFYYGMKGKMTEFGFMMNVEEIPEKLMERIEDSFDKMVSYYDENKTD
ncbi:MAG: lactate dehydrogenase [Clostridiales bacterium]|nr:lactate dehydrogenase [Clostridiales bacterium]